MAIIVAADTAVAHNHLGIVAAIRRVSGNAPRPLLCGEILRSLRSRNDVPGHGTQRAAGHPHTIQAIGDLSIRQHAAEARLERAELVLDEAVARPDAGRVAAAQIAVAKATGLTTAVAPAASNKLFELSVTCSTLAAGNLHRHWRNARPHTRHDPVQWNFAIIGIQAWNGVGSPSRAWSRRLELIAG